MDSRELNIEGIGKVVLQKSEKAHRLNIRIAPYKGVVVSVPQPISYEEAEKFILLKKTWILKSIEKVKLHESNHIEFDQSTSFTTRNHSVKIIFEQRSNVGVVVTNTILLIRFPNGIDIHNARMQKFIRQAIEHTWRKEAEMYLPQRLKLLGEQYELKYNNLTIRKTTTRWGSCTAKNDINLSIFLMQLPDDLIDYVLLHELCHTIHKNHGPKFWQLLEELSPGARQKSKKIRKFSIGIY